MTCFESLCFKIWIFKEGYIVVFAHSFLGIVFFYNIVYDLQNFWFIFFQCQFFWQVTRFHFFWVGRGNLISRYLTVRIDVSWFLKSKHLTLSKIGFPALVYNMQSFDLISFNFIDNKRNFTFFLSGQEELYFSWDWHITNKL